MEYHIELLNILYNDGFEKVIDRIDELVNKTDTLTNLIVMNMKNKKNIELLCNYLKVDVNKYMTLIKKILCSNLCINYKSIFLENLLLLENDDVLNLLTDVELDMIMKDNLLEKICSAINVENWKNSLKYYNKLFQLLKEKRKDDLYVWIYDICDKYDYRCKSYSEKDNLNDNVLYFILENIVNNNVKINLENYIDNSCEIDEITYEDVDLEYRDMIMVMKMINVTIYYSMDEVIRINEKIEKNKSVLYKLEEENCLLNEFDVIKKYITKHNEKEIKTYEKRMSELYNKINTNLMDGIYEYYVSVLRDLMLFDVDRENSICYSNIVLNIIDYYIFYINKRKFVYKNIKEKESLFKYMCDIFMSNISNININIKLIDFYKNVLENDVIYILNRMEHVEDDDSILNMVDKLKRFYIELDNYDDYYKYDVKNKIINIFNKIFNKPKICEKYLELYIKKESNTFSKFIIDMNETTSLCIDKYVYYYKKKMYKLLTTQYFLYVKELCIYYNYVISNNKIDDAVIDIWIGKINKSINVLVDILDRKDYVYNICLYLIKTILLLYESGYIKNLKNDTLFDKNKYNKLYNDVLDLCDSSNDIEYVENFGAIVNKIDSFEVEIEKDYEDIPDDYLDPIGNVLIRSPVLLPSSKKIMELEVIKKHLLYHSFDPFNREELTLDKLNEYNNDEEIQKK